MSAATSNPPTATVAARRTRRHETGTDFDAFARRILRAYGRRVADGDIEALRPMVNLAAELDTAMREAVAGLRSDRYGYSWQDIADRLGITRQAAQQRFGDKADRGRLDQRLIDAGLNITVADLAAIYIHHYPGTPASSVCPGCGYRYPDGVTECPTNTTVRPLLLRRRNEDQQAIALLSPDQFADLTSEKTARTNRVGARRSARPSASPDTGNLLDLIPGKDSTS